MLRWTVSTFACFLLVAAGVCRAADEGPEGLIPQDAVAVLRIKAPGELLKKLDAWAPQSEKGADSFPFLEVFHENMELVKSYVQFPDEPTGSPACAEHWIVFFWDADNTELANAWIVRPGDLKRAKASVGSNAETRDFGKWHVVAADRRLVDRFQDCRAKKAKSFADGCSPRTREMVEKGDVSLHVNLARVRSLCRSELDELKATAAVSVAALQNAYGLRAAAASGKADSEAAAAAQVETLLPLVDGAFHLVEDSGSLTVGVTVDEQRITLESYVAVAPASATARFFERNPPSEMKPLGQLPPHALAYYGVSGDLTPLEAWMTRQCVATIKKTPEEKKALYEKIKSLDHSRTSSYVGSLIYAPQQQGPAAYATTFVIQTQPEQQYRADENRFIEWTGIFDNEPATVKPNAETIRKHPVDLLTTTPQPAGDSAAKGQPVAVVKGHPATVVQAGAESIESRQTRIATLPGLVLQSAGGGRKTMEDVLEAFESGKGADRQPPWKSVRDRLGSRLNFVALVDVPRLCAVASETAMCTAPPDDVNGASNDASKQDAQPQQGAQARAAGQADGVLRKILSSVRPTYAGLAVATDAQGARLVLCIPREQVVEMGHAFQCAIDEAKPAAATAPAKAGASATAQAKAGAEKCPTLVRVEAAGPADEDDARQSVVVETKLISGPRECVEQLVAGLSFEPSGKPAGRSVVQVAATSAADPDEPAPNEWYLRQAGLGQKEARDLQAAAQNHARLNLICAPAVTIVAPVAPCTGRRLHGDEAKIVFGEKKQTLRTGSSPGPDGKPQPVERTIDEGISIDVRPTLLDGDKVSLMVQVRQCNGEPIRGTPAGKVGDVRIPISATIRTNNASCDLAPGRSVLLTGAPQTAGKEPTESFAVLISAKRVAAK